MARKRDVQRISKSRRVEVRREEFNQLVDLLNERGELLNAVIREQKIQFERIAQLQADVDRLRREWERLKSEVENGQ
jgi:Ribonuclease G/E